jgi:molybdenum cofactor biosynthesis enzyme MoaA
MYNFDGTVKNCIRSSDPIGNLQHDTIEEILNGVKNRNRQISIQRHEPVAGCQSCYNLEKNKRSFDIVSDRVFYIRELKENDPAVYDAVGRPGLQTVDIRWTNLCNFACVYCNSDYSSRWANELKIQQAQPSPDQVASMKWYVTKNANTLKHVYLAGGEPLLMKENLELLAILKTVNPDINLRINTNLSKVDTQVFDRICEFKNVHWIVSLETVEAEYEYIRYGGTWSDFLDNLTKINQLNHKISFNMLHFLLNSMSVFACVDYLKSLGFHNNSFIIGPMENPEFLNIRHLPELALDQVRAELTKRIDDQPGYLLEDSYRNMLSYLNDPFAKNLAGSLKQIQLMDQRRGLDSSQIFTELYGYC